MGWSSDEHRHERRLGRQKRAGASALNFVGPSVSFGVGSDIDTDVGFEGSLLIGAGVGLIERSGVGMGVGRALGLGRVGEGAGTLDDSAVGSGVGRGLRGVGRPQSQTNVHDRDACPGRPCNLS